MSIVARLHRLRLRLFGHPYDGWPDPPHDRHLTQLAHAHRIAHDRSLPVTHDDLAEMMDEAWRDGFRCGWVNEEQQYWREHGEDEPET